MTNNPQTGDTLTPNEIAALAALAAGHRNAAAARHLHLSLEGFKHRLRCAFTKLEASNRAHAVAQAFADGYLWVDTGGRIHTGDDHTSGVAA